MAVGTWYNTEDKSLMSPQAGAAVGQKIGGIASGYLQQAAVQDVVNYAQSPDGYQADETSFVQSIAQILGKHGATPGPIVKALIEAKQHDLTTRTTTDKEKRAESQKAAEEAKKQAARDALVSQVVGNTPLPDELTSNLPTQDGIVPLRDIAARSEATQSYLRDQTAIQSALANADTADYAKTAREQLYPAPEKPVQVLDAEGRPFLRSGNKLSPVDLPDGFATKPAKPATTPDQDFEREGFDASVARAQGNVLDPRQSRAADAWEIKHGIQQKPGTSGQGWLIDPQGRPYKIVDNELVRPNGVENMPMKPEPREGSPIQVQGETGVDFYDPKTMNKVKTVPYPGGKKISALTTPLGGGDLTKTAQAILAGQVPADFFTMRGNARNQLVNEMLRIDPNADITGLLAGTNVRKKTEQGVRLLDSIVNPQNGAPSLTDRILSAYEKTGFGNYPAVNAVKRKLLEQTGNPAIKEFDNLRTSLVFELGNALAGGAPTDQRIAMEVKNWPANPSRKQVEAAISAVKEIAKARKTAYQSKGAGNDGAKRLPGETPAQYLKRTGQ